MESTIWFDGVAAARSAAEGAGALILHYFHAPG